MDEPMIKIECFLGSVEIVPTTRFEDGAMIFGGFCIHRDMNGREVYRTKNEDNVRVTWE